VGGLDATHAAVVVDLSPRSPSPVPMLYNLTIGCVGDAVGLLVGGVGDLVGDAVGMGVGDVVGDPVVGTPVGFVG
jgi:hypothetical protein